MLSETELFTLADLIARQPDPYYSKFGIEQVEQTYFTSEVWGIVCKRFNECYFEYFLNAESLEQWQIRLQVITDRILPRLSRIDALQKVSDIDDISMGYIVETTSDGSSSGSSSGRSVDYPDSIPLDKMEYGGVQSNTRDESTSKTKGKTTGTQKVLGGATVEIEESMRHWHDIITEIVDGYASAFLSLIYF